MRSLRTFLLATDFGPASQVITDVIARLARAFGSCVSPLHVVDIDSDSPVVDYCRRQVGQRLMAPLVTELKQQDVE